MLIVRVDTFLVKHEHKESPIEISLVFQHLNSICSMVIIAIITDLKMACCDPKITLHMTVIIIDMSHAITTTGDWLIQDHMVQ